MNHSRGWEIYPQIVFDMAMRIKQDYRNIPWFVAGANCQGYMLWAFTDNVSPMNAFKNRYGLIEIDLQNNRARRPKASASWFRKLGESRELTLDIDDEWR